MCISPQLKINSSKQNCKSRGKMRSRSSRRWRPLKTGTPYCSSSGWGPPKCLRSPPHTYPWAAPSTHPTHHISGWRSIMRCAHFPWALSLSLDYTVPVRWEFPKQDIRPWEMYPGQQKSLAWSLSQMSPSLLTNTPSLNSNWVSIKGGRRSLWSQSHSVLSDSLWAHGLYSPWNSPG